MLEIKKEVENEASDTESGPSTEAPVSNSNDTCRDHQRESQPVNERQRRYAEPNESHPKLVIKFRDLWKNSGQNNDLSRKRKKRDYGGLQSEIIEPCESQGNKRHKSESRISSKERVTRSSSSSSSSTPRPLPNREKNIEGNCLEENTGSDKEKKQDTWNSGRITRLNKNLNFVCESCGMCFKNRKYLQSHRRYYTPNVDLQCTLCDIGFSRDIQLTRHISKAHSALGNNNAYKYKCHLCPDRFERKPYLIAHVAHLHKKHVVSYKRNRNSDREIISSDLPSRKKKKKASARRSKRGVKHTVQINQSNNEVESNGQSASTTDLKLSTDQCNNEEYLTPESSIAQTKNNYPILEQMVPDKATAQQLIVSPINKSIEKVIEPTNVQEIVQEDMFKFRTRDSKMSQPKRSEEENQVNQVEAHPGTASQNVHPQLGGDLVDHLGNPVGSWCVSEPSSQLNKTDNISGCSSKLPTIDPDNTTSKKEMASRLRSPRSDSFRTRAPNSSTISNSDNTAHLDNMLRTNVESSTHEKSTSEAQHNCTTQKVDLNQGSDIWKPVADHEFDQQVGLALSRQILDHKTVEENGITDDLSVRCNNVGIDLVQVDDFGGIPEATVVNYEDEGMSDSSIESVVPKIETSSSNSFVTDLTSLDSHSAAILRNYNNLNNPKIRDVRVLLVKLENMLDLSRKNYTPKSSSLETCSLVKTKIADHHPCEKLFSNQVESEKIIYINESRSVIPNNCKTADNYPKVPLDCNALQKHDQMKESKLTGNRCYFCNEVFRNNFSATSHYLSLHTTIGVLQCCLCYESFKNLRLLRNHLYRNHNTCAQKRTLQCCLVCKKKLSNPSLSQRCSECDRCSEFGNSDSRQEQFLNTQDLTEKSSTRTLASGKLEISRHSSMSPFTKPHRLSVPSGNGGIHIVASEVNRESANNDTKHSLPGPCKEELTNFKCSACDRVFFERSELTEHLATAHTGVICCDDSKTCQDVVQPQIPLNSDSRNCTNKTKNHCNKEHTVPKFSVGKKRKLKCDKIRNHDKFCKKKLSVRHKLELSHVNSSQRSKQQWENRRDSKICYNYKCHICGLNCCCRKKLKTHKTRYLTSGNNVCSVCGLTFAWKHVLVTHLKTAHNPKVLFRSKIRCEICSQGFYNEKFLRIHLAHFHKLKYFQCSDCRIRFDTRRSLDIHRQYYSRNVGYLCSICGDTLKCKYSLKYHTAQAHSHSRDKLKAYKYSCDTCSFAFVDKLLLQAHIGHFHNAQNSAVQTQVMDEDVPPSPLESAEDMELTVKTGEIHIDPRVKTNSTTTPEILNENHKTQEVTADALSQKVRRNTTSEYKCNVCKLSFAEPYAILNHEWEFSNEGTYTCDICNRKFMTDSHLKNHRIKHYERTVVRSHVCYVCKEDFSTVDQLRMHGLHLHGPQFVWEKGSETTGKDNFNGSDSQIGQACDANLKDLPVNQTYGNSGLMKSHQVSQNEILSFQKVVDRRSCINLHQQHSNKDLYCCDFCGTNFDSESLLKYHFTKHVYYAYYGNSSRYLCLICKNKFRTNDVLRAHVVHCHTSNTEETKLNSSEAGCSKIDANNHVDQVDSTYNEPVNVARTSTTTQANQNQTFISEKRGCLPILKSTSPGKKVQLSNTSRDVGSLRNDHSYFTSVPREIDCDIASDLGHCNTNNCSASKSKLDSENPESSPDEAELFSIKNADLVSGSEKYACSICIDVFHSIAQFREHFAKDHVRNGMYRCTLCGQKFSLMSLLKDHTVKHKPSSFACCGKKFKQATDFIRHRFSHDNQTNEKRNGAKTPGSSVGIAVSLDEYDDESNGTQSGNSWKCEICDVVFLDFEVMLKHWDVCVDTNGLRCDMCRAMFKNSSSLQVHKMTYHKSKQQNRSTVQNRSRFLENSHRTPQTATQTTTVNDNQPGNKGNTNSVNTHAVQKMAKVLSLTDKFAKETESIRYERIPGKPTAIILYNSRNKNESCGDEQNAENDTASSTELDPKFTITHSVRMSTEPSPLKSSHEKLSIKHFGEGIRLEMKGDAKKQTNSQTRKPNDPVSNRNACSTNRNSLLNYFTVQDSSDVRKQHSIPNDFSTRLKQIECKEKRLPTSQRQAPSAVKNFASIRSTVRNSNNFENGKVKLNDLSRKSIPNNHNKKESLKLPNTSPNAANIYYIRIPPPIENPDTTDDVVIVSDFNKKSDKSNFNDKILSGSVPLPLNPPISSTSVINVPRVSESSQQNSNQTIESGLESNSNDRARKRPHHLPSKSSTIVVNPVCVFDNNRITNEVHSNSSENNNGLRSPLNNDRSGKVPILPAVSGTLTHGVLLTSYGAVIKGPHSSSSKIASITDVKQNSPSVRCSYCNLSFTDKTKFVEHVNSHKTDNQCPACGLNFSNGKALEQHLPEHECSTCVSCKMVFFFSDSIAYPPGTQPYCSSCNSLLPSPTRKNSRTRNSGRQIMKCGICMDAFGTISEMTVHFKQVHSSFVCGICESKFSTKVTLRSHMQTHGIISPETTQCRTCKKYFNGQLELAYHELSH